MTVRVVFTRPDYTYIEQDVLTDPKTGNFTVTQKLDMVGYWNIFAINGAITDRLFAQVTDPSNPQATPPHPVIPENSPPNYTVLGVTSCSVKLRCGSGFIGIKK